MSRIGRLPIQIPKGVTVKQDGERVTVEGPKGKDQHGLPSRISIAIADGTVTVNRADDTRESRALHGLVRKLLSNSVTGVSTGFTQTLEIVGVGYRAAQIRALRPPEPYKGKGIKYAGELLRRKAGKAAGAGGR
jgi:large subunit ribosomal protein L6